ncbi:MAG: ACT domain-containing protein [Clostridiales bacterium]|jgi:hypothetical protein|nr:ACT domain-containing protein [Clostridiales bacterium]
MVIDQLSVFVENKLGHLTDIAEILGGAGIDMRALSIADTAEFGVLRIIVGDTKRAKELLSAAGCVVSITRVLAVSLEDKPGSLAKILRALSDAGISVEYIYAFITQKQGNAYVVLRVEDNARAAKVLEESGVGAGSADELFAL